MASNGVDDFTINFYIRGYIYSLLLLRACSHSTDLESITLHYKFNDCKALTLLRISDEFYGDLTILTTLRNEDRKVGQNTWHGTLQVQISGSWWVFFTMFKPLDSESIKLHILKISTKKVHPFSKYPITNTGLILWQLHLSALQSKHVLLHKNNHVLI
jgi:hypothetical protein